MRRVKNTSRPCRPTLVGIDLYAEMDKYLALPVFHRFTGRRPHPRLVIMRWEPTKNGRTRPRKYGHAYADGHEIMLVDWHGLTPHDLRETLLHECVHAHGVRGHGPQFKILLRQAAREAFDMEISIKNRFHGHIAPHLKAAAEMAGPPTVSVPVPEVLGAQGTPKRPAPRNVGPRLPPEARRDRALRAAQLRAEGLTYAEIAQILHLANSGVAHRIVKKGLEL